MEYAIRILAAMIAPSVDFDRVRASVQRWAEREISEEEKEFHSQPGMEDPRKTGVLHELTVIGIEAARWQLNLLIELAVAVLKIGGVVEIKKP
jgi:hypothetical protein